MKALEDVIENEIEEAYNKGLNDAWELAKKLWLPTSYGGKNSEEVMKIFGCDYYAISKLFTPQEALTKLEAYEKEQEQKIAAGDIVTTINGECEYLVTSVQLPNTLHTVNTRNGYLQTMKISSAKKTGKHIDIQPILEQIEE